MAARTNERNAAAAFETAERRLYPRYDAAGAYPIFFVWESGILEAPFNNLQEIAGEGLFQEFVNASYWKSVALSFAYWYNTRTADCLLSRYVPLSRNVIHSV